MFSAKIPDWMVQIPAVSVESINAWRQGSDDAPVTCVGVDVNGVFDDSGVGAPAGDGGGGDPAEEPAGGGVDGETVAVSVITSSGGCY